MDAFKVEYVIAVGERGTGKKLLFKSTLRVNILLSG